MNNQIYVFLQSRVNQSLLHPATCATTTHASTSPPQPTPTTLASQRKHATHATHKIRLPMPPIPARVSHHFSKKFPPLKSCHFRYLDLYSDQKIIIIKRHLPVFATCYSKCLIFRWMPSWTLLYITVHISEYSIYLER